MVGSLPDKWKENALDSYEKEWVTKHMLTNKALLNIGNHYCNVLEWIKVLKTFPVVIEVLEAFRRVFHSK